ncbi:uncharacterized protein LOC106639117 [Copidosoma floridanum]|uniref:uncharacterized protein LOC106639117 n=1 Tax=Copidosoma floridanum TaxID=29053 RepID=UPI0006C97049|nr:uncharacterized protein LOC106639117 [Copidosoma floridanum]
MASMCGSSKGHPALTTSSFYRPGAYPYQNDYYMPPRSAWSRVPPHTSKMNRASSTWKVGSAMLIIIAMLVLIAVFAIAGLALWMGALRTDTKSAIVGFVGSFRVTRGEKFNPMLKLNTSMVFREKEQKYRNIFELLFRRSLLGPSYKQTIIDKFENNTLKVFFRLYLDRRKIPRSITNVEDTIVDIIAKETYSVASLFKDMELDLTSIIVKRINPDGVPSPSKPPAPTQQRNTMITKNGILRPNRNISIITNPKLKSKPEAVETQVDPESEIDFANIPTIKGTYTATKINASSAGKKPEPADESKPSRSTTTTTTTTTEVSTTVDVTSSTMSSTTTTTTVKPSSSTSEKAALDLHFNEFHEPDFETSPWRPIIPPYLNADVKPGLNVVTTSSTTTSTTTTTSTARPKIDDTADVKKQSSLPSSNTLLPPMLITVDEDSVFPHDRIVPQEMINFRVNGKFKDKMPDSAPPVEVSSSGPEDETSVQVSSFPGFYDETDEQPTLLTGIGVAEPVLDSELELESRNKYSDIVAEDPVEDTSRQPVYTSYRTPDLNGGSKPPLVRVPGTLKPFSHTIPVDKINIPANDEAAEPVKIEKPIITKGQGMIPNLERIVEIETFVKDASEEQKNATASNADGAPKTTTVEPVGDNNENGTRNSTFIKVDIIKHVPTATNLTGESSTPESPKNPHNDTLKPNVVIELVTLAPVKSNIGGVGQPVGPRPKVDQESRPQVTESENRTLNSSNPDDTDLLDQLFGLQSAGPPKPENNKPAVEQIVEVVTSISTKISSSIKADQMILKLVISNATSDDNSTESTQQLNSDRKIAATHQDKDQFLVESLRKLAEVRTGDEPPLVKRPRNESAPPPVRLQRPENLLDLEKLKKIADVVANATGTNFTLSRDGVPVMTKPLIRAEERSDKMMPATEEKRTLGTCTGYRCGDGKCLPAGARCNMLGECSGAEDEANCTCADFLRAQEPGSKICDGTVDCWDYSDETDCDWCQASQFVCGNSRTCVDQSRVCDGERDCPHGEDEKRCAALIDDEPKFSSSSDSRTYRDFFAKGSSREPNDDDNEEEEEESTTVGTDVQVSGREISPSKLGKNGLTRGAPRPEVGSATPFARAGMELSSYNDQGFLSVRKNGKWGRLCLSDSGGLLQRGKLSWTIEDLGRAVCRAITYRDFDKAEVQGDKASIEKTYYSLALNDDRTTDRTSLTFKRTKCSGGQVLRVKCKNFECGIRTQVPSQARIVGGGSSSAGSWPWQVALYKEGDYQCGGAIIGDRWIVSAAHCFYRAQDEHWVARIGATRKGSFPSPYEQVIRVDYILLHPEYVDNGFINDIALLRLEKPLEFSDYVRPVCLPAAEPESGAIGTATGWGQLYEIGRMFPDTLQEVELPLISTEECRRKTLFLPLYRITSGMICAGVKDGGRDACLGDSGGPLVSLESDNKYTLHGITSNGYGCGRPDRPGVYTKVYHYMGWIERVMSRTDVPSTVTSCKGHRCPLGECLPRSRVCNGYLECSDGSDERNCSSSTQ